MTAPVAFNPNFGLVYGEPVAGRSDNAFSYGLAAAKERPTARTTYVTYEGLLGSSVLLDGSSSYDPSNLELSFRWRFLKVPPSSAAVLRGFRPLDETETRVSFTPDIIGSYEIALQVSNGADTSDEVIVTASIFASLVPYCRGITPNADFIWSYLGDSWQYVQDRKVFSTAWSAYMQSMGSMLLDALQADTDKSLMDIQRQARHRWYAVDPRIELSKVADWSALYGYSVGGDAAITGQLGVPGVGFAVNNDTLYTYSGIISGENIGKSVVLTHVPTRYGFTAWGSILTNQTSFLCAGLTPTRDGITVAAADEVGTLFPELGLPDGVSYDLPGTIPTIGTLRGCGTKIVDGNRIKWFADSPFLAYMAEDPLGTPTALKFRAPRRLPRYTLSAVDAGPVVLPNDYIVLDNGGLAGAHRITDVWRYDSAVEASWTFGDWGVADLCVLFGWDIPEAGIAPYAYAFDLLLIDTTSTSGSPPSGRTWEQATFSIYAPLAYSVPGTANAFTNIVNIPRSSSNGAASDDTTTYRDLAKVLNNATTIPRLLHIQGGTYPIKNFTVSGGDVTNTIGDVTEFSVTILEIEGQIPAGLAGVPWRISNTIKVPGHDFPNEGVCAGDTLVFRVVATSTDASVAVAATVLGAYEDLLGVEFTIRPFILSDTIPLDIRVLYQVLDAARMVGFKLTEKKDSYGRTVFDANGHPDFTLDTTTVFAADALALARSSSFQESVCNVAIDSTALLVLIPTALSFRFELSHLVRNTIIPVHDEVRSLPCLFEMIVPPSIRVEGDKKYMQLPDGKEREVNRYPYALAENIDYMVERAVSERAEGVETQYGRSEIRMHKAYLLSRRFLPGDIITIEEGYCRGQYTIVKILGQEYASVSPAPPYAQYGGAYTITRKSITGTHVRFLNKIFSPATPVPGTLWCEEAFFDNSSRIENIHGYRVKVSLSDFSSTDTQLDYLAVIRGMAYVTGRPATISDIQLGVSILLGLPFTVYPGRIVSVDQDYQRNPYTGRRESGRVVVEIVNEYGDGTGILNSFVYPEGSPDTRLYYEALLGAGSTAGFTFQEEEWYGLSTNPATGVRWAEGDMIPAYTCLSNGVQVRDYINDPDWFRSLPSNMAVLKYHTWLISVREDLALESELDLIHKFLFETGRPAHTNFMLMQYKALYEQLDISDEVHVRIDKTIYEQAGGGFQSPLMTDAKSPSGFPLFLQDSDPFVQLTPRLLRDVMFSATGYGEALLTLGDLEVSQEVSGYDIETGTLQTTGFDHITDGFLNPMFVFADDEGPGEPDLFVLRSSRITTTITIDGVETETTQRSLWDGYYHLKTRVSATEAIVCKVDTTIYQDVPAVPDPDELLGSGYPTPDSGRGAIMRRLGHNLWAGTIEVLESDATLDNVYGRPYCVAELTLDDEAISVLPTFVAPGDYIASSWNNSAHAGAVTQVLTLRNTDDQDIFPRIGEDDYVPSSAWELDDVTRLVLDTPLAIGTYAVTAHRDSLMHTVAVYTGCTVAAARVEGLPDVLLDSGNVPCPRGRAFRDFGKLVIDGIPYQILDMQGPPSAGFHIYPLPATPLADATVTFIMERGLSVDYRQDVIPTDVMSVEMPGDVGSALNMEYTAGVWVPSDPTSVVLYADLYAAYGAVSPHSMVRFLDSPDSLIDLGFGCGYAAILDVTEAGLVLSCTPGTEAKRLRIVR